MKRRPRGIVVRPLAGILVAMLSGTAITGDSLTQGVHLPPPGAVAGISQGAGPGQAMADPEPLDLWWALLNLWVVINCQIVICENEIDPLLPIAAVTVVDPATVVARMKDQIEQYFAVGIRTGLTDEEKQQGILNLEQTRWFIEQRPEELPVQVYDLYRLMITGAIEDLRQ